MSCLSCQRFACLSIFCILSIGAAWSSAQDCVEEYPATFEFGASVALPDTMIDLVAVGDLLFGLDEPGTLQIFDIADPLSPVLLASALVDEAARLIEPAGDWLYIAGGPSGVHAVDISDPAQPVIHLGVIGGVDAFEVELCAGQLFVAQSAVDSLVYYSCADPLLPVLTGSITLTELTAGEFTGPFYHLDSCQNALFAFGGRDGQLSGKFVLSRMMVEVQDQEVQIIPAGYFTHSALEEWENCGGKSIYPHGADLSCSEGRVYLEVPSYTRFYTFIDDEIVWTTYNHIMLFFVDTTEPVDLVLADMVGHAYDPYVGWRDAARLAILADDKLAVAETGKLYLYNLQQDGSVESSHTLLVDSPALGGSGNILFWGNLNSGELETCDVSGSGFDSVIDQASIDPSYSTQWYEGASWSQLTHMRHFSVYDDFYGIFRNHWWLYSAESDGSLISSLVSSLGPLYFFTDQYAFVGPNAFMGICASLVNWRNSTLVYSLASDETWSLDDDDNVFVDNLVYHPENGDIAIYDFTVNPNQLVGLIVGPDSMQFTRWLIRDNHLLALGSSGDSNLMIYDVSDPTQPAIVYDFGLLNNSQGLVMSINGDVLSLVNNAGPDYYYDISDITQPDKVTGDFYPGEVFGDIALTYAEELLNIYRVTSLTESELIGVYYHDAPITKAKRWQSSLMVMDEGKIVTLIDICDLYPSAVGDQSNRPGQVPGSGLSIRTIAPNPFNPRTKLAFALEQAQRIQVDVFDLAGRHVVRLADRTYQAGEHEVVWEGRDAAGRNAAAGSYFLRVKGDGMTLARKVTLLK